MRVSDGVLVGVPAAVAQVQAAHECDLTIDEAKFLVVCPVHHSTIVGTIYRFQPVQRHLSQFGWAE